MDSPAFRSLVFEDIPAPDFADVQLVVLPEGATTDPVTWAKSIFSVRSAPLVVRALLGLRQLLVPIIGVNKAESDVFDVSRAVGEEALIAANDDHLDFRVGVGVDAADSLVRVTTAVRFKGWRGRVYFIPVRPLHGPVIRAMMNRAARTLRP